MMCFVCLLRTRVSPRTGAGRRRGSRAIVWSRGVGGSGTAPSGSLRLRPPLGRSAPCWHRSAPPGSPSTKRPGSCSPTDPPDGSGCAGARVRAPPAGRIDLPRPQPSRLGSGRDGHRRPRASGSAAAGGVSQPLVAGASGRLLAASCVHHGQRARFDRHDRRDKGLFRLGRLWLLAILRRTVTEASLTKCLPFRTTPTGWAFSLRF
jgi:hypothetical protein